MELPKRRILINEFFNAQSNDCPAICMFHNRALNIKMNRLYERCLRIICNNKYLNCEELLVKDNFSSMHHNDIDTLAIEMYKVVNERSSDIMTDILKIRENTHYNLRHASQFLVDPIHSVFNGSESASYLGPKLWEQIPFEIKMLTPLLVLKKLENENLRITPVKFGKFAYQI